MIIKVMASEDDNPLHDDGNKSAGSRSAVLPVVVSLQLLLSYVASRVLY